MKIDLGLSINETPIPKVGQSINLSVVGEAGLRKLGFLGAMMLSKLKTTPNDVIYFGKNYYIQCHTFDKYERFAVTAQTEVEGGPMWGNSIYLFFGSNGYLRKVCFQVIMNKGIAEVYLEDFRRLCTKAFGTPAVATEQFCAWQDDETAVVSARNGNDAVFEWNLV